MAQEGYSRTPLVKKLGIKEAFRVLTVNEPEHYWELISPLPANVAVVNEGETADFIHLFSTYLSDLESDFMRLKDTVVRDGSIWISWPKGGSSIATDLKGGVIRDFVLQTEFVDVKVCAVDNDWSGLKFMIRKELR